MDRTAFGEWIAHYERLWRAAGTAGLGELFAPDASYRTTPWAEPIRGLARLADFWDAERDAPDEEFTMESVVVAVDGDVGVARVEVHYGTGERWRDLWVVRFDADGRCVEFEEWPIAP